MGCGGSKVDVYDTFADQVRAGILPDERDLDAQNVFDRFRFEPGQRGTGPGGAALEETDVYPTFHGAACKHPLYGDLEHFLMARIHTVFDGQAGFRPPMRAIFVLDHSGSMGQYHDLRLSTTTKLALAKETLLHIASRHLRARDEVAIVVCNEIARTLLSLRPCFGAPEEVADMLKQHLDTVVAFGGSNLKAGVLEARLQALRTLVRVEEEEPAAGAKSGNGTPNVRLFVLTDFGRNMGEDDQDLLSSPAEIPAQHDEENPAPAERNKKKYGVLDVVRTMAATVPGPRSGDAAGQARPRADAADEEVLVATPDAVSVAEEAGSVSITGPKYPIYTTFLLIGLPMEDSRTSADLERIGNIVGCNAVTVTPGAAARERFDNSFECMVTPVAREMRLELHASPFSSKHVKQCCNHGGPPLLRGDGEFYRARSIFPSAPGAEVGSIYGGVLLFRLDPPRSEPAEGCTTTVAMRVETGSGHQRVVHYTMDLPCVIRKPTADGNDLPPDVFQTPSIRKAIALWYYTNFSKSLLRRRRSSGLEQEVRKFKAYFEDIAKAVTDPDMEKEVELWDQLVEIKKEELKKNKSCCAIL